MGRCESSIEAVLPQTFNRGESPVEISRGGLIAGEFGEQYDFIVGEFRRLDRFRNELPQELQVFPGVLAIADSYLGPDDLPEVEKFDRSLLGSPTFLGTASAAFKKVARASSLIPAAI